MRKIKFITIVLLLEGMILLSISSLAAAPATSYSLTYQGRIVKSDGTPLQYSNVSFIFQITNPSGQCVIYQEQVNGINMANSAGIFDIPIGTGTVSWPGGVSNILDTFNNSSTYVCGACSGYTCTAGASTYSPIASDGRVLRVSFFDGHGWKTVSPDTVIRSVPFAGYAQSAQKLGSYDVGAFVLKNDINGNATCDSGSFLTWNAGTQAFGCVAVSGATGGTVTDVTVASPLAVTNGQSTPHITIQAASSSQPGYLTSTDWTTFNNKLGSTTNFGGDVSGSVSNISVDKIKNAALSFSSLSSGDFLKYSGGNWINSTIAVSDIANLSTNLAGKPDYSQFPTSCTAAQTMTFISPVGGFTCTTIAIPGTQVSGNIAGNAAGFSGSLGGDVTGTQSSTTVTKIRNVTVSATAPSPGDVLKYDNGTSSWVPSPDTASTATSANTASTIVSRDASGNFAAGTITANLTGNVTGNLTGNVTGNVTGSASLNVLKAGDSMSGNLTHAANTGNIYTAGTGAGTVTLQGPTNAIGANYILRLPTSQSSGTQALVNDGSGNLSWQSLSGGSVTSVGATSPLSSSGGTTPTISLGGLTGLGTGDQILGMNSGATGYEYKNLTGTANRVNVTHGTGSITLSSPQDIHSAATPTFAGLTLSAMSSPGLVKNDNTGLLSGGNKVGLTTDVSGVLPTSHGGTGASSFSNNRVIASDSSGNLTSVTAGANNAVLQQSASGPVWSTATYPSTTTINQLLYSSAANTVAGLATMNNSVLTTDGFGVPSFQAASEDLFNQYALRAGRSGGQTIYGGTGASETLTLSSTSNSTRGNILLNPDGGNVGIGVLSPQAKLDVNGVIRATEICDETGANCKDISSGWSVPSSLAGDVSGAFGTTSVDKIKGKSVTPAAYAAGQVLRYDGTNWVNATLNLSTDVTGTLPIARGGTGAVSQTDAINNLLPSQTGNTNKILQTNGTNVSWADAPTAGITALTGDVTASGTGSVSATIANSAVTTAKLADNAVTSIKIQNGTINGVDLDFGGANGATSSLVLKDSTGKFADFACSTVGHVPAWTLTGFSCQAPTVTETDPKVGSNTLNMLSKWDGSKLVASTVSEVSGNVGIGATANAKLTVEGGMTLRQQGADPAGTASYGSLYVKTDGKLYFRDGTGTVKDLTATVSGLPAADGSAGTPSVNFTNSTNMGLYRAAAGVLGFSTAGTERMRITATGNVGIGNASATNTRLDVGGQIRTPASSVSTNSVDWSGGNTVTTSASCSSVSFANMRDGGNYTLVVTNTSTTQCSFNTSVTGDDAGTVSYRFMPANAVRTSNSHTIYSMMRVGTVVYVSWITGF